MASFAAGFGILAKSSTLNSRCVTARAPASCSYRACTPAISYGFTRGPEKYMFAQHCPRRRIVDATRYTINHSAALMRKTNEQRPTTIFEGPVAYFYNPVITGTETHISQNWVTKSRRTDALKEKLTFNGFFSGCGCDPIEQTAQGNRIPITNRKFGGNSSSHASSFSAQDSRSRSAICGAILSGNLNQSPRSSRQSSVKVFSLISCRVSHQAGTPWVLVRQHQTAG